MNLKEKFEDGVKYIPGGVNSPVRNFSSVGRDLPIFAKSASGSKVYSEEDKEYIDYIGSWGPMILGHKDKDVTDKVIEQITKGSSYGIPTLNEIDLAKKICSLVPGMDMVRLTTSGTEATMSAIRLSRAYTNRNKIIKFEGCYHGHSDSLLVKGGSFLLTSGIQDSNGITKGTVEDTITLPFGDTNKVVEVFKRYKGEIASIILEPLPANMGVIETDPQFLKDLRSITKEEGSLLIFDEVISGFRLSLGGAAEYYGVTPDLTTLGKIIGGGYPVGAFGGREDIMRLLSPIGDVYHAGTLSGNPVSVVAGMETLKKLENNKDIYSSLSEKAKYLEGEISKLAKEFNIPIVINRVESLFTIFFTKRDSVKTLDDVMDSCEKTYNIFFTIMLDEGILLPPSRFEGIFLSTSHSKEDLLKTIESCKKAFDIISKEGE